jgi:hypothetical protein
MSCSVTNGNSLPRWRTPRPRWNSFAAAGVGRAKLGPLQAIFFQLLLGRAYDDKDVQEAIATLRWWPLRQGSNRMRSGG